MPQSWDLYLASLCYISPPISSHSGASTTIFQYYFNIHVFKYVQASKMSFFKHAGKSGLIPVLLSHYLQSRNLQAIKEKLPSK